MRGDPRFMRNVVAWEVLPERPARTSPFPSGLDPRLVSAVDASGIHLLYQHQAQAVQVALEGRDVVVVTGTASGKSLCYHLPVLNALLADPQAGAVYLFPTKALAQDQAAALAELQRPLAAPIPVHTYDGDTPLNQRGTIRQHARILITNPDMLHAGILPHHPRWSAWLENLRFVVLDELHTYRGVFGSHMANVLRRLQRLCRFYGSNPQFLCTSATIANPQALAERLIERPVQLVDQDGSPRAEKHVIVYNPPVVDAALGVRKAYTLESQAIAGRFLRHDMQTVVFARARRTTEVLLGYLRDEVARAGGNPDSVRGYRGGYLPLERRAIERGLRDGSVRGVVATNALELGVDIGPLAAAVLAGYPGTIASTWQQAGRAGRRAEQSVVVLVASGAPLDQYLATHPRYLFERPPEHGLIQPDNLAILMRHLRCAAFELPFAEGEAFGTCQDVGALLQALHEAGELHASGGAYRWVSAEYPADGVSLRTTGDDVVVIQETGAGRPVAIGEVDACSAPVHVYPGAVYLHEGRSFMVRTLDWEKRLADVEAAEVDYYTEAAQSVDLQVTQVMEADEGRPARRAWGRVLVTTQATAFRKVKRYTHETLGFGTIDLPAQEIDTTAYWLWPAPDWVERLEAEGVLLAPNDYGPSWTAARTAARARDQFRCRQCSTPEAATGRPHDVHHVKSFREFGYRRGDNQNDRLANMLDNLITLCPTCHHRTEAQLGVRSALGGLANALANLAPLHLMCDPRDLGVTAEQRSKETRAPTVTLFDRMPDGLGFAEQLYELHDVLLAGALEMVQACACREGCPACVGPVGSAGASVKEATIRLLQALIDG